MYQRPFFFFKAVVFKVVVVIRGFFFPGLPEGKKKKEKKVPCTQKNDNKKGSKLSFGKIKVRALPSTNSCLFSFIPYFEWGTHKDIFLKPSSPREDEREGWLEWVRPRSLTARPTVDQKGAETKNPFSTCTESVNFWESPSTCLLLWHFE